MKNTLLVAPLLVLALPLPVHAHSASRDFNAGASVADEPGPRPAGLSLRVSTPGAVARGALPVEFTLLDRSHARLELLDLAGRVVRAQHVGGLGGGRHALDLSNGRPLAPGIYVLRLDQSGQEIRARTAVLF